jgi:hypothetical protein
MISEDFERVVSVFKIVSPQVHVFHDCQYFFVINFIVSFNRIELATMKGTGMENTVIVVLGYSSTQCFIGGISFKDCKSRAIEVS